MLRTSAGQPRADGTKAYCDADGHTGETPRGDQPYELSLGQGSDEGAEDSKANGELAIAGGALASSAVLAEGIQIAGTAVLGELWTGTESPVEAVAGGAD